MSTFVVSTTYPAISAIGFVEIVGPEALSIIEKIFKGKKQIKIPMKIYHGYIASEDIFDEVIVKYISEEYSFSGMETVQISCHGNPNIISTITKLVEKMGARRINQQELISIACENKKIDEIQAEALMFLPYALTNLSAKILLDQYNGALSKAIKQASLTNQLDELLETAEFGISLVSPKKIVIAGKPNVGKSTLFNFFVKQDRVIVSPIAGTTRDPIKEIISIKQIPFYLIDTPGAKKPQDILEQLSMGRSLEEIEQADLVIFLFDATTPLQEDEFALYKRLKCKKIVACLNKIDIARNIDTSYPPVLKLSALKGTGVAKLKEEILGIFGFSPKYIPQKPVVFTHRQRETLLKMLR
jgi:tRNA modification GTPase